MAVFSFNSIILGPEVKVNIVGQRAFSLVSKTTAIINTTFEAVPHPAIRPMQYANMLAS